MNDCTLEAMLRCFLIVLGFNVNPCGSFCVVSQRKGRREMEGIVEEMKERDRRKRGK